MKTSAIVKAYIRYSRKYHAEEIRYFAKMKTVGDAMRHAALAIRPDGRRFHHQRRRSVGTLKAFHAELAAIKNKLQKSKSFEQLYDHVESCRVAGIGPLTIYDTAHRIGARLNLQPKEVYIHSGAKTGARNLGLDVNREVIPISEFCNAIQKLSASEIEDFLCIYKDELGKEKRAKQSATAYTVACYGSHFRTLRAQQSCG